MDWLHPTYAWFGLALPLVVGAYVWARRKRAEGRAAFGDTALVQDLAHAVLPYRRRIKAGLVVTGLAFLIMGLAGPRFGTKVREVEQRGVDLVVALDVSASMRAEDVAPNRLERAKNEIKALLDDLGGDRVGLVIFAGDAFVQCPLTTDYNAVRLFLDVAGPELMPTPGTDFGAAVQAAVQAFDIARPTADSLARPDEARSRALLLVSDGENHVADLDDVQATAREAGVVVFTAGVGETDGAPIPIYENGRQVGVKQTRGRPVQTRLEEDALTALVDGGAYFRIARTSSSLPDFQTALNRLETSSFGAETFEEYAEMYMWPLAVALVLLFAEALIPVRRTKKEREEEQAR